MRNNSWTTEENKLIRRHVYEIGPRKWPRIALEINKSLFMLIFFVILKCGMAGAGWWWSTTFSIWINPPGGVARNMDCRF